MLDLIGKARAEIDTKHTDNTQSAYDNLVSVNESTGVITFGSHGVDMTREKTADGKFVAMTSEQSGARQANSQAKKHIGNTMTKEQSDEHGLAILADITADPNLRIIGIAKDGKYGWKIMVQDVSGTKSILQVQSEHHQAHEAPIEEIVKAGDVGAVMKFLDDLVNL